MIWVGLLGTFGEGESTPMLPAEAQRPGRGGFPPSPPRSCCCGCGVLAMCVLEPLAEGCSSRLTHHPAREHEAAGQCPLGPPPRVPPRGDLSSPSLCHCEMSPAPGPEGPHPGRGRRRCGTMTRTHATSLCLEFCVLVLILFPMLLYPPYTGARQTDVLLFSFSFYERHYFSHSL